MLVSNFVIYYIKFLTKQSFLLLAIAIVWGAPEQAKTCEPGWTQYEDRCFYYFRISKKYDEAFLECRKLNAVLPSIRSEEENRFLSSLGVTNSWAWIGGRLVNNWMEGRKMDISWMDGSASDYENFDRMDVNYQENYDSIRVRMGTENPKWSNSDNSYTQNYICAKSLS